ncbi:hypothetical protein FACS189441_8450 [Betaproteobacteria bacterium]|nr:hypothetical protein FACS189441_8450 [Betaproteobacteria bacterium]
MNRYILCGLGLVLALSCGAQVSETGDYLLHTGGSAVIYSGKEEANYSRMREHPYLDTQQYREGTVWFDGRLYPGMQMRLNVYTDELILLAPGNPFGVIAPSERVDSAFFPAYAVFYNLPVREQVKAQQCLPDRGYYARLYNGAYPVWKRQTKHLEKITNGMNIEQIFTPRTRFYIYKDGRYQSVGSKGSILKLFASKKKELNLFIRQQQLDFRGAPDDVIVRLVTYYESLNP